MVALVKAFLRLIKLLCICILVGNSITDIFYGRRNQSTEVLNAIAVSTILVVGTIIFIIIYKEHKTTMDKKQLKNWASGMYFKFVLTCFMTPILNLILQVFNQEDQIAYVFWFLILLCFLISPFYRYYRETKVFQFQKEEVYGDIKPPQK